MPASNTRNEPQNRPLIWGLLGARTGDNQQVSALANALGWAVEEKRLNYSAAFALPSFLLGATLLTVREAGRTQLRPPWPDIVIAAGRRSVAPARWIKQQSGGKAKLVQLGRPRAPLRLFDLVITTRQYGLPPADNVLTLSLPLQPPLAADAGDWQDPSAVLPDLPRPWTGILVGGTTWPSIMDFRAAADLARDLNRWIGHYGGSALITTSPRSGRDVAPALETVLTVPHFLHPWAAGAHNPYRVILRSADQLIVTSDSISMLADACRSGKPTAIWQTRLRSDPFSRFFRALGGQADRNTALGGLLRSLTVKGLFTPPRHVERLMEAVVASKRASRFDPDRQIEPPSSLLGDDDMELAIRRVRALLA